MPDELFLHKKNGKYFWIEAKSDKHLSEKLEKIYQYKEVARRTDTTLYIIFAVFVSHDQFDLYSCEIDEFFYEVKFDGKDEKAYFDKSKMKKLNKYPIQ